MTGVGTDSAWTVTWTMVGRRDLLADGARWLGSAGAAPLLLTGPAGAGRTTVLEELARQAGGAEHHVLRVFPAGVGSFVSAAHLLPAGEQVARSDLLRTTARSLEPVVARTGRPVLLAIDDVHLLDEPSAVLAHHLVIGGLARLAMTMRDGAELSQPVRRLQADPDVRRLVVRPLDDAEVAECLAAALTPSAGELSVVVDPRAALWFAHASCGNPRLLRELVTDAVESGMLVLADGLWRIRMPPRSARLDRQVSARLDRLSPAARALVVMVAFGEPLPLPALERVTPGDAIDEAERLELIRITTGDDDRLEVRLAHRIHGDAIRSGTEPYAALTVARRLARLFAGRGTARHDRLRSALWQLRGGMWIEPQVLVDAALQAAVRHDGQLAAELALAAADAGGGWSARLLHLESLALCGRFDEAARGYTELARAAPREAAPAIARTRAGVLALGLGRLADARTVLDEAAGGTDDPTVLEVLDGVRTFVELQAGDIGPALAAAGRAADPAVDPVPRWHLLAGVVTALTWAGRPGDAVALGSAALRDLTERGDGMSYLTDAAHVALGFAVAARGHLDEARTMAELHYGRALHDGADDLRACWAGLRGRIELTSGQVRPAAELLREAAALLAGHLTLLGAAGRFNCLGSLAEALVRDGRVAAARALGLGGVGADRPELFLPNVELGLAWIEAAEDDRPAAVERVIRLADRCAGSGCVGYAALAVHAAVDFGAAHLVLDRLRSYAAVTDDPVTPLYAARAGALVDEDATALDLLTTRFAELGLGLVAADTAADAHRLHLLRGDRPAAREAAARRRWQLAGCGLLGRTGVREDSDDEELSRHPMLTGREYQVARLAASGLTNRDISARLFLSVRTIENHLHRVFAKLAVTRRTELDGALDDHRP